MEQFSKELLESKLRTAALAFVNEERMRIAAEVLEEAVNPTVPGIVKWDAHDGIGARRSYSFRHPITAIKYTIDPTSEDNTYHTNVLHPEDNEPISLGYFNNPNEAAKCAREHHDALTVKEAVVLTFSEYIEEEVFKKLRPFRKKRKRLSRVEREHKIIQLTQGIKYAKATNNHPLFTYYRKKLNEIGVSLRRLFGGANMVPAV